MATQSPFKVSPNNFLGHDYEDFLSKMYALALSKPNDYFLLRAEVVQKVKRAAVGKLYDTFFNALTEGNDERGNTLFPGLNSIKPKYPEQKVNDFCLSAAATLDEILNDLVNIIMPDKINEILGDKIGKNKVL